jgi:hypothetical protein
MVTHLVKHITPNDGTSPNRVLISRDMGKIGGKVKPVRAYAEMKYVYEIDPANGDSVIIETAIFPSGKYDALDFIPNWHGHRFIGWFKNAASPSAAVPSMDDELTNKSSVVYSIKTVYAHWQLPTTVTFDANTNGGAMPDGWNAPCYYAGQPYGTLPSPTHETLTFTGWYVNGVKVTAISIVPEGGVTLVAQFSAQSYSVDLNDAWRLEAGLNPDASLYDGVYQSFANTGMDESMAKMYIDVVGYTHFRIYITSNSEQHYDYTVAMKPDIDPVHLPSASWGDLPEDVMGSAYSNTLSDPSNIRDYMPVDYELDGGAHRICILYSKDSSYGSGNDCGYVLIPKEQ